MRRRLRAATAAGAAAAAATALLAGAAGAATAAAPPTAPYVVVLTPGADPGALARAGRFHVRVRYTRALRGFAAALSPGQVRRLEASPLVDHVERDVTVARAAGARVAGAPAPLAKGETAAPGVRRIGAVSATGVASGASSAAVAVLDTGIDLANGDLNAVNGTNCVRPNRTATDDNGHGTHVAGVIGARNRGTGMVGVAPDTRLYAVKMLGANGTGTLSQILCGIDWVTANAARLGIRVANMSIAGPGADDGRCGTVNRDAEHQAICRLVAAGVTVVAAAGNERTDLARSVPGAYPEVLTVTAMSDADGKPGGTAGAIPCDRTERDDRAASYSDFAATPAALAHTLAAPGTCIVSTRPGGGTATYEGTSQAAPHAAGVVALCMGVAGAAGPCAKLAPAAVVAKVRGDAIAAQGAFGFTGDLLRPLGTSGYGPLVRVAA
jgi:subtilisin family serine protease